VDLARPPLLESTEQGLYCAAGGFHVDPWQPVERAILTHAHADHAHPGCARYLAAAPGRGVLALRLGADAPLETLEYGERRRIGDVDVSLHPAGHILGSAQVRIEHRGEVWVVSGDYKLDPDPTCARFEPQRCHTFLTESTFGLPVYRWSPQAEVLADLQRWWQDNARAGVTSLLLCYALGKAQRVLAGLEPGADPIYVHGAVERINAAYRAAGVKLADTRPVASAPRSTDWSRALILAPPSAFGSPWQRRFRQVASGLASGWMRVRGHRRRRALDRGFVLSDHADWPGLLAAVAATGAARVLVTHGQAAALARYLGEQGLAAEVLQTRFTGEADEPAEPDEPARGAA
jgi:putative mRNA 3-end processing factor